jgi:glycosyltransferase involved in cell wall biosynthesis
VLSDETAFLAEPTPSAFAAAILEALRNPAAAAAIGERARSLAESKYSDAAYMAKTHAAMSLLSGPVREEVAGGLA